MKKTISLIAILSLIIIFSISGFSYADALDTIQVEVDKTNVQPGEEVKLTINFGTQLGAYTFDIAYDNKIFEYVSVDGGTPNDLTDKVRVVFHDSSGGTNARENMSIIFRAKSDITTSNPTELSVTGEGISNHDTSVTYDDIIIPIVKNITVEPNYKDYTIKLEHSGNIIKEQEKEMTLSYSSSMGRYYEHARLIAEAITPDGASVQLIGKDADTQTEQDIIDHGWGDAQGYKIGGKDVSQVLNLRAIFSDAGDYTITLKLIDRDNSDAVIAENTFKYTVLSEEPQDEDNQTTNPSEENKNDNNKENNSENANQQKTDEQEKPSQLPKTGNNIYLVATSLILLVSLTGLAINKKNS